MCVCADLTTLVPPLMTCMSTSHVPFECETRLTSENSAYEEEKPKTGHFQMHDVDTHDTCYIIKYELSVEKKQNIKDFV